MPRTYRPYEYDYDSAYVGRTGVIENYLDKKFSNISIDKNEIKETIESSVHDSLGNIDCKFCSVHNHIEKAKNEIISSETGGCTCNLATKEDIANAVAQINTHTDEKFDEIDFDRQFSDLNQQIANLNN
jgi:hypothetical protein